MLFTAFAEFIKTEGYDGVILIESSEGYRHRDSNSYVFYSLGNVGTYATWKSGKELDNSSPTSSE